MSVYLNICRGFFITSIFVSLLLLAYCKTWYLSRLLHESAKCSFVSGYYQVLSSGLCYSWCLGVVELHFCHSSTSTYNNIGYFSVYNDTLLVAYKSRQLSRQRQQPYSLIRKLVFRSRSPVHVKHSVTMLFMLQVKLVMDLQALQMLALALTFITLHKHCMVFVLLLRCCFL